MVSDVDGSCRIYDAKVEPELIGPLGDVEHLRKHLEYTPSEEEGFLSEGPLYGEPVDCKAKVLYWMTDTTPHESMPLRENTHRKYFRLVAGKVTHWYAKHSTPNSTGVEPDAEVLHVDKFAEGA